MRDVDFRRYLAARLISVAGTLVSVVALPVLVYRLTGSAGWTSAVAAGGALPYLLFGLVAGSVADRVDRRRLMVGLELGAGAALATIPAAHAAGALTAVHVLAVGFAVQTCFVFFDAANFGALPALVGRERLTSAYSAVFGGTTALELVIPPLAGLAVAAFAPSPLLAVNAATAVASALLLRAISGPLSAPAGPSSGMRRDIGAGLAFLWRHRVVRTLTLVGTTHAAAAGAWVAMLVPWADEVLGVRSSGDARLGALFSCWGIGAVVAARTTPRLARRLGRARLALAALPASLVSGLAVLAADHWIPAVAAATVWGWTHSTVVLNAITYRQQVCPDDLQSRVNTTARMLSWGVGQPLGAAVAGAVAVSGPGPRGGLAAGLAILLLGVIAAWSTRDLRHAPREET
ncbi:MFS transporter [Actinokineospora sp. UTMC 2448]|uniref:MFS transporter n=1 Tax=Actinokineospora sp. UTMC 2448 TaxID=2268449 RepID=UPI00216488EB|nr:MFS transporter [Actinokineospora sp. UTMC 2448]UVS79732.1 putative multidrug-efflux transporter [Actinokineospora sp. UTMC 2448]